MAPDEKAPSPSDRRADLTLRELLDEMIAHVRDIARRAPQMTDAERAYAQERLEWLADEIWESAASSQERRKGDG
ncbi:MAG TPA: hypothetical protein VKA84_05445 [Gemmatimonadaceae bacterium]|nr:hypothetical protein [Gemmatimonadaceae bacterium]